MRTRENYSKVKYCETKKTCHDIGQFDTPSTPHDFAQHTISQLVKSVACCVARQSSGANYGCTTSPFRPLLLLAGISVEGKWSVSLIRMNYRIIIVIIIIISLGKIVSSYIANTSRTHACTDVRTHTHTRTRTPPRTTVAVRCVGARDNGRSASHWNKLPASNSVCTIVFFFAYTKI